MTINEAIADRIRFVRLPHWAERAFIELPILPDGLVGPWARVVDPSGETQVFIGSLKRDSESRYEAYQPSEP